MKGFSAWRWCRSYRSQCQIYMSERIVPVPLGNLWRLNLSKLYGKGQPCSLTQSKLELYWHVPSFICLESWSCSSRGLISPPTVRFMMASTSARSLLSRKLKSPNQKTWSNLVVTSAVIKESASHKIPMRNLQGRVACSGRFVCLL